MNEKKCDMSATCGLKYHQYWMDTHVNHTMTEDELKVWFEKNCGKCSYMSEICMYGEGDMEVHDGSN
ncbi:MAG: hypothetical protein NC311_06440 [Muribaculaceae bacterium]|nr:hypothetical protein [Muribaculaceae bacterium]